MHVDTNILVFVGGVFVTIVTFLSTVIGSLIKESYNRKTDKLFKLDEKFLAIETKLAEILRLLALSEQNNEYMQKEITELKDKVKFCNDHKTSLEFITTHHDDLVRLINQGI